jgi:fructose-bisphosphate aldolase class I
MAVNIEAGNRDLCFTVPDIQENIGGVIYVEETVEQVTSEGNTLVAHLCSSSIHTGIKLDMGLVIILDGTQGETATTGLDELAARC